MLNSSLTFFTKVKISTNSAFISDADDSFLSTAVTVHSLVNDHSWVFLGLLFWLLFGLGFGVQGLFNNDRLIISWDPWLFLNFLRNLRFDFGDDLRHHLPEFVFNEWLLNMGIFFYVDFLFLNFDLRNFLPSKLDFLNLGFILLNLDLTCNLHKFLTVLPNGDFDSFESRVEEDFIVTLVFECNLVSIWIEVAESKSGWESFKDGGNEGKELFEILFVIGVDKMDLLTEDNLEDHCLLIKNYYIHPSS